MVQHVKGLTLTARGADRSGRQQAPVILFRWTLGARGVLMLASKNRLPEPPIKFPDFQNTINHLRLQTRSTAGKFYRIFRGPSQKVNPQKISPRAGHRPCATKTLDTSYRARKREHTPCPTISPP